MTILHFIVFNSFMFSVITTIVDEIQSAIDNGRRSMKELSGAQVRATMLKGRENYKRVYRDLGEELLGKDPDSISCHDLEIQLERCLKDAIIEPSQRMRCAVLSHLIERCHEGTPFSQTPETHVICVFSLQTKHCVAF